MNILIFFLGILSTVFGAYQPGTPGGTWTEDQALIIRKASNTIFKSI